MSLPSTSEFRHGYDGPGRAEVTGKGKPMNLALWIITGLLTAVVAWGRFGPESFAG
ncbi:hypothetical protein [Nocardiopsis quinghaiensis]|uniref:hypothetical protein n=1 Tax=Nocardiopsis quinghaiensis TaxID=464995 RepID=UPI001680F083|nr:hypothetical protein [Nocardiopsis quinghaiensis]